MTKRITTVLVMVTACWSSVVADEVSGKITGYGIVRVPAEYRIHLPKGAGEIDVVHITRRPPIRRPDRTISHGYERKGKVGIKGARTAGYVPSFLVFGFVYDYEMVPGKWTFEVRFQGRTLCKRDFQVSRE